MGLGMAQVAAAQGFGVRLLTRSASASEAASIRLCTQLQRQCERGRLSQVALEACMSAVHFTHEVQALSGCAAVIESVQEDRDLKTTILQQLEAVLTPDALITSNTSGLPITGLGATLRHPSRFIGLHFFSPAERMPLVEVVQGQATSAATLTQALALVASLGKQSVVVRDGPGFFTSRVFAAYLDEAVAMVGEGVAPDLIEQAAIANGRAVGPLAVLDEVSLQLNLQQAWQARADGLPARCCRPLAEPVLSLLVALGRKGRREGGGFYETASSGERGLWPGLASLFPPSASPPPLQVQQRLRCIEALEALRCLEERVIARAEDADTASVLGLGFPAARGGVLRDVETLGLAPFVAECEQLAVQHGPRFTPSPWLQSLALRDAGLHTTSWSPP
jgi:3-hydroxyacyl-CoA dehydrogenase/enoyl-CoA hydratase/3-hydroxybutyryl-CoA epimerase